MLLYIIYLRSWIDLNIDFTILRFTFSTGYTLSKMKRFGSNQQFATSLANIVTDISEN